MLFKGHSTSPRGHLLGAAQRLLRGPAGRGRRPGRRQRAAARARCSSSSPACCSRTRAASAVNGGVAPLIELTGRLRRRPHRAGQHLAHRRPARPEPRADRRAVRRDRRLRRDRGLPGHAVPALLQRHAGAPRLLGHHDAGRADHPRRRGARGGRQALPREVLRADGARSSPTAARCSWCRTARRDLERFCTRGLYLRGRAGRADGPIEPTPSRSTTTTSASSASEPSPRVALVSIRAGCGPPAGRPRAAGRPPLDQVTARARPAARRPSTARRRRRGLAAARPSRRRRRPAAGLVDAAALSAAHRVRRRGRRPPRRHRGPAHRRRGRVVALRVRAADAAPTSGSRRAARRACAPRRPARRSSALAGAAGRAGPGARASRRATSRSRCRRTRTTWRRRWPRWTPSTRRPAAAPGLARRRRLPVDVPGPAAVAAADPPRGARAGSAPAPSRRSRWPSGWPARRRTPAGGAAGCCRARVLLLLLARRGLRRRRGRPLHPHVLPARRVAGRRLRPDQGVRRVRRAGAGVAGPPASRCGALALASLALLVVRHFVDFGFAASGVGRAAPATGGVAALSERTSAGAGGDVGQAGGDHAGR